MILQIPGLLFSAAVGSHFHLGFPGLLRPRDLLVSYKTTSTLNGGLPVLQRRATYHRVDSPCVSDSILMSSRPFGIAFQSQSQGYIQPVLWKKSSSICLSRARKATASSCTMMPLNLNLRIRIYWGIKRKKQKTHKNKTKSVRCRIGA